MLAEMITRSNLKIENSSDANEWVLSSSDVLGSRPFQEALL